MKKLWRRSAGSVLVACLMLNLTVVTVLYHVVVSPGHDDTNSYELPGFPGTGWLEQPDLPAELVIPIPKEPDPNRPDLTFEEARQLWDGFIERSHLSGPNIDPTKVDYYTNISDSLNPYPNEWDLISENGFVVVNQGKWDTFEDAYYHYWVRDLPVIITTDTILNTFHLLFDQFLQEAEKETFRPLLAEISTALLRKADDFHGRVKDQTLKANMEEIVVFFSVASELLETGERIPDYVRSEVKTYVNKILEAKDVEQYPGQDYTQYKPRGHYAGDPLLETYFRAMMWYGRKSLDMQVNDDVLQACLISLVVLASERAQVKWATIYDITSYLVGKSDSLNFVDILKAMHASLGKWDIDLLKTPSHVENVMEELKKDEYYRPRILSDVVYKNPSEMYNEMEFPKIFQFMGQRYVPDSEIMQSVMYDRVPLSEGGRRGLPWALDVMAALGSPQAVHHLETELTKYGYEEQLKDAWASAETKSEGYWGQSAYFGLLRSYKELISGKEDERYPSFMRTEAWADEKLNTALGSWTELRHDTILYAKQPYSMGITCGTPDGIVEPYPTFYERMEALSIMMRDIIVRGFDLDKTFVTRFIEVFEDFADINYNLASIAKHELEGERLTPDESAFVREIFVEQRGGGCGGPVTRDGWLPRLIEKAKISEKTKDSRIVADVATDPGSPLTGDPPRILHVATGFVRTVIVAYEMPNGDHSFFVGPVYSFYEFPMGKFSRLNDDDWKKLLDSDDCPPDPFWTSSFMA